MKTLFRILLYTFLILLAGVGLLQLFFTFYFNEKIKNDLQEEVAIQTNDAYQLQIDELNTNIFKQSVFITGFLLRPGKNADPDSPKYYAAASEINFDDCSLFAFLSKKKLTIGKVELVNPSGYIYRGNSKAFVKEEVSEEKFSLYNMMSKTVKELHIVKIDIRNAHIAVYDDYKDTIPSMTSEDNELMISNLRINKSVENLDRLYLADKVSLLINRFAYTTKDSLYTFNVKQLRASYTDSTLSVDSMELHPNFSKNKFADEAGSQTDRMKITVVGLDFNRMNVKLFFEKNWFIAQELKINGLNVAAFRDKNDRRKFNRPRSVQQILKNIPIYSAIDVINLENGSITYEEVAVGSVKPGKIFMTEVNASITGFTSDSTLFSKYQKLKVIASAKFMDSGKLQGTYSFPLNTSSMVFDCSGKITNMPFQALNPMLEPNAKVSMKGGKVDSLVFSFHANDKGSKGKLKFCYHDLKMELMDNKNKKDGFKKAVLTFLVHRVIIKESNPSPKQEVRITDINYTRDPSRFIFNYSWKSVLSGIKPAIGVPAALNKN